MILSVALAVADVATLASVKEKGELVIASSPDFPPFESLQGDGSVVGIEVDLWKRLPGSLVSS